jgi:tetratricopeptide (TPR) repeat protein
MSFNGAIMKAATVLVLALFAVSVAGKAENAPADERTLRKYRALYLEAVCQREAGNDVACFRLLERANRLNPNGAEALFDMAQFAETHALDLPVVAYLEKAHALCPDNKKYLFELSNALLATNDDRGVDMTKSLLSDELYREKSFALLCSYYEAKGDYDRLCATLDQWRPIRDDDELLSTQKLRASINMGHLQEALLIADTLIARTPSHNAEYVIAKGEALLGLGRTDEVLNIIKQVELDDDTRGNANILLYKYALATKNQEVENTALKNLVLDTSMPVNTRVAALRNYLDKFPPQEKKLRRDSLISQLLPLQEEDATLYGVISSQMLNENTPDSLMVPIFNKMLDINPSDEYSRLCLMQNALSKHDYTELKRLSTDGLKENARHPLFYFYAGAVLQIEKDDQGALDMYARGLKFINADTHTELVSSYYSAYADALHKVGRKDEAYVMYDSALVYNGDNIMCLNNYAYFLSLDETNLDKARQMSAKTLEQEPEEPTYLDTYAWILFLQGNYVEARKYIDKALKFTENPDDPDNVSLVDHAGDIYYHLGFTDKAADYWRRAAKMDPSSALIKKKAQSRRYYKE